MTIIQGSSGPSDRNCTREGECQSGEEGPRLEWAPLAPSLPVPESSLLVPRSSPRTARSSASTRGSKRVRPRHSPSSCPAKGTGPQGAEQTWSRSGVGEGSARGGEWAAAALFSPSSLEGAGLVPGPHWLCAFSPRAPSRERDPQPGLGGHSQPHMLGFQLLSPEYLSGLVLG